MTTTVRTTQRAYPAYKDSGIEWLGEIPEHWEVMKLKFAATTNMGQSPSSNDYNDQMIGYPFLQGNAELGRETPTAKHYCETAGKICNVGDILISVRAPVGALNIADQKYGIGRGLCAISPKSVQARFLWYIVHFSKEQLISQATGSTYEAVSVNEVGNIWLIIPPLPEQEAIARFLDHKTAQIDALIAKKEALLARLADKRTALISQAVTQGLDPTVPMRDSGIEWLGEIPIDWTPRQPKYLVSRRNAANANVHNGGSRHRVGGFSNNSPAMG